MNGFHLPEDRLPRFFPFPESLLNEDLTFAEFRVYLLLLRRSFLSARNPRWVDGEGRVYLYYPIKDLAKALDRGETCVKSALKTLEEKDLILRVSQGLGKCSRIYVKFPAEEEPYDPMTDAPCGLGTDAMPDPAADAPCGPAADAPCDLGTDAIPGPAAVTPSDPAAVTPSDSERGGKVTPSNIERRERKDPEREEEKGGPSPAEAQSADCSEDGTGDSQAGKGEPAPVGTPSRPRRGARNGSPRLLRVFAMTVARRRSLMAPAGENYPFPLKPAVDWFKMAVSKNGRENQKCLHSWTKR